MQNPLVTVNIRYIIYLMIIEVLTTISRYLCETSRLTGGKPTGQLTAQTPINSCFGRCKIYSPKHKK